MKHLAFQTEEKIDKGMTTMTSGTNRRKVISPKVRKQVIKSTEVNNDTTGTTSRTNRTPSDRNCIKIHAKQSNSVSKVRPSELVVTIA